jgi:hypothetical protein
MTALVDGKHDGAPSGEEGGDGRDDPEPAEGSGSAVGSPRYLHGDEPRRGPLPGCGGRPRGAFSSAVLGDWSTIRFSTHRGPRRAQR